MGFNEVANAGFAYRSSRVVAEGDMKRGQRLFCVYCQAEYTGTKKRAMETKPSQRKKCDNCIKQNKKGPELYCNQCGGPRSKDVGGLHRHIKSPQKRGTAAKPRREDPRRILMIRIRTGSPETRRQAQEDLKKLGRKSG